MEGHLRSETQKSFQNPMVFPPHHRRRSLQSETYSTMLRIVSLCREYPHLFQSPESAPEEPHGDFVAESNNLADDYQTKSQNSLGGDSKFKEVESSRIQQESVDDGKEEVYISQDAVVGSMELEGHLSHPLNLVAVDPSDMIQSNNLNSDTTVTVDNQTSGCVDEKASNLEDKICDPEVQMEGIGTELLEIDEELSFQELRRVMDSCFETDMFTESSIPAEENKGSVSEKNFSEEIEHGLHLKEMELENLISSTGAMGSCLSASEVEEMEEGEISGDITDRDKLENIACEDSEKHVQVKVSEVTAGRENSGQDIENEGQISISGYPDQVENDNDVMKVDLVESSGKRHISEFVVCEPNASTKKADQCNGAVGSGRIIQGVSGLADTSAWFGKALSDEISNPTFKDGSTSQVFNSSDKDAVVSKKRKKGGPVTKERRERKKKKKRIKRAEKNRKLGVKRLKLQPVLKPQKVTYCRHYLKGRCSEGEKCKFSHDMVPLTKSKPCCHFARQACMKGDDCPFDHQLSKYPCNNYLSTGFCHRGADCLFSHEKTKDETSAPDVSTPELKTSPPGNNSSCKAEAYIKTLLSSHRTVDASGTVPGKSLEKVPKQTVKAPRGVSLLSPPKSSGDSTKFKEANLHLKSDDATKVGTGTTHNASNYIQRSVELREAQVKKPQGINFLFGKASSENSRRISSSSLFTDKDYGIGKPLFGDLSKQVSSSSQRDDTIKSGSLHQTEDRTPPSGPPRGMSFLSFNRTPVGDSDTNGKKYSLHANKGNSALPGVLEGQNVADKLLSSGEKPSSSLKTPLLANMPSSVQKSLQSTLTFAARFESEVKLDHSVKAQVISPFNSKSDNVYIKSTKNL